MKYASRELLAVTVNSSDEQLGTTLVRLARYAEALHCQRIAVDGMDDSVENAVHGWTAGHIGFEAVGLVRRESDR